MRSKLELYILRHGEAVKNVRSGLSASDADRPLTISGKREIEEISYFLKKLNIKFSLIVSSPLKRAHQTAYTVSTILMVGHEPFLSSFISEIAFGNPSGNLVLKKGGFVRLQVLSNFPKMTAELCWLLSPRLMRRL